MAVARGCWDGRMESYCLTGIEFQFYKIKKSYRLDSGDGCTTMSIYLISMNVHLKMVKILLWVFYHTHTKSIPIFEVRLTSQKYP